MRTSQEGRRSWRHRGRFRRISLALKAHGYQSWKVFCQRPIGTMTCREQRFSPASIFEQLTVLSVTREMINSSHAVGSLSELSSQPTRWIT
jgi:hypothetical protein